MSVIPTLAVRGSTGISLNQGPPNYELISEFPRVTSKNCKCMTFSPAGQYFAWFDGAKISIVSTSTWKVLVQIERTKTAGLLFSPKGTYIVSWEPFFVNGENPKGSPNLHIWKSEDGSFVHEYIHKKQINWHPQWSKDERVFARILDGEVLLYEKGNFKEPKYKIQNPKSNDFSISPSSGTYHVVCYMPGTTGPSFGKLFKYPRFEHENCVANKTFFKADRVDMYWNSKGTYVLLLTSTDVDKTGSSYYGKSSLHFMSIKGDTAIVLLNKEGPIYDVSWNPTGEEFCVLYGYMPSKATLFNNKCEIVYEFNAAPRNSIYFNPHGNMLLLAGFGNISGHVEVWDAATRRRVTTLSAPDTTLLQWSPDGCHFFTATTAPRLRVGNGFKIWHYSGALLYERPWNKQEELWEVCWQTYPEGTFKKPVISSKHVEGILPSQPTASKEAYRPPAARGLPSPAVKFSYNSEEPTKKLSKIALKTKKKRESKRQAKLQQQQQPQTSENASEEVVKNGHPDETNSNDQTSSSDTQRSDKSLQIKKIKSNLSSIEKLKGLKESGKVLDSNQLKKIERETELREQLRQLQI